MLKVTSLIAMLSLSLAAVSAQAQSSPLVAPTANLYCDTFYDTLKNSKSTSIDGFLYDLTQQPSIKQAQTTKVLMYNSRALHGSSFQTPRALVMYGLSDLILAFNGSHEQYAYDMLEIMCYNRSAGEFQFRAIQFLAEPAVSKTVLKTLQQPDKAKYRYALAGYLLNCDDDKFIEGDSDQDLRSLRASMATERARYEIYQRLNLNHDLEEHSEKDIGQKDEVVWKPRHDDAFPVNTRAVNLSSYPAGFSSMVARVSRVTPEWMIKLSRF